MEKLLRTIRRRARGWAVTTLPRSRRVTAGYVRNDGHWKAAGLVADTLPDPRLVLINGRGVEENWFARLRARREKQGGFGGEAGMMFDGGP